MAIDRDGIRHVINGVREQIGRDVVFHVPAHSTCPRCVASGYFDATNNTTFDFTCPVCHGLYYLNTTDLTTVLARIHWTNAEAITATPGGKYFLGAATITVEDKYKALAESAQVTGGKVVVDGYDMTINKIIPVGAPEPNRYRIVLANIGGRPE